MICFCLRVTLCSVFWSRFLEKTEHFLTFRPEWATDLQTSNENFLTAFHLFKEIAQSWILARKRLERSAQVSPTLLNLFRSKILKNEKSLKNDHLFKLHDMNL